MSEVSDVSGVPENQRVQNKIHNIDVGKRQER